MLKNWKHWQRKFQHTAARRRLFNGSAFCAIMKMFQHTAARRRLNLPRCKERWLICFNTQPPEGGWPVT